MLYGVMLNALCPCIILYVINVSFKIKAWLLVNLIFNLANIVSRFIEISYQILTLIIKILCFQ